MFFPPLIRLIHSSFGWSSTNISSWDGADQWRAISPFQIWSKLPSCICAALGKYFSHTCITGSVTDHQEELAGFSSLLKDTSEGSGMRDSRTLQPKPTTWATSGGEEGARLIDSYTQRLCASLWGWYCSSHVSSARTSAVWHLLTVTVKQEEENQHFQMHPNTQRNWEVTVVAPAGMKATDLRSEMQ